MRFPLFALLLFVVSIIGCAHVEDLPEVPNEKTGGKEKSSFRQPVIDYGMDVPSASDEKVNDISISPVYPVIVDGQKCLVKTITGEQLLDCSESDQFVNAVNQLPIGMVIHRVKKPHGVELLIEHSLSEYVTCPYCPDHD